MDIRCCVERKEVYCLGLHAKIVLNALRRGEPASIAQPCEECKYAGSCDFDWITYIDHALKKHCGFHLVDSGWEDRK